MSRSVDSTALLPVLPGTWALARPTENPLLLSFRSGKDLASAGPSHAWSALGKVGSQSQVLTCLKHGSQMPPGIVDRQAQLTGTKFKSQVRQGRAWLRTGATPCAAWC